MGHSDGWATVMDGPQWWMGHSDAIVWSKPTRAPSANDRLTQLRSSSRSFFGTSLSLAVTGSVPTPGDHKAAQDPPPAAIGLTPNSQQIFRGICADKLTDIVRW